MEGVCVGFPGNARTDRKADARSPSACTLALGNRCWQFWNPMGG